MWPVFPATKTLAVVVVMLAVVLVSLCVVQPDLWRSRAVRRGTIAVFGAMFAGLALWGVGRLTGQLRVVHFGAGVAYAGILVLAPAAAVLPFAAAFDRAVLRAAPAPAPTPSDTPKPAGLSRRSVLRFATGGIPAVAAIGGASGFVTARAAPRLPVVTMRFPDLHPDLDGLRILQLSDLHLGAYMTLDDLEANLRAALAQQEPDLVVLTGDLADDVGLIPRALGMVHAMRPRLGAIASLGNHEYLHGIEVTRPMYEKSPVPLLVSAGRTLRVGRARLYVAGADDPVHMGGDIAWMLGPSIRAAAKHAPTDADFRLLLCHRPEGFVPASKLGFDLTLSGHTHGGQIGFLGRSLFEKLRPETFWWGPYVRPRDGGRQSQGPSRLYTTSGMGHWFPFRFGCPTEMPLVVLERSSQASGSEARRV